MTKSKINLPTHEIAEFCKKNHIARLSLFGSVLRDDFQMDSDIDFLVEFEPKVHNQTKITIGKVKALLRSVFILGVVDEGRKYYWKLFFWSLFNKPKVFSLAITYAVDGYHYRKVFIYSDN